MEQGLPSEFFDVAGAQAAQIVDALFALPLAAALGALLAFRPKREGTPPRSAPVIQTQIILAVIGTLVMFVVGSSVARAFGIVGAANLIRYRATIADPKDAVVMLASLSVGLATGVELYGLAVFATLFVLGLLWLIESFEPEGHKLFELKVSAADPAALRQTVETVLRRYRVKYELRSAAQDELVYEAKLPWTGRTDRVSHAILALRGDGTEIAWTDKKQRS